MKYLITALLVLVMVGGARADVFCGQDANSVVTCYETVEGVKVIKPKPGPTCAEQWAEYDKNIAYQRGRGSDMTGIFFSPPGCLLSKNPEPKCRWEYDSIYLPMHDKDGNFIQIHKMLNWTLESSPEWIYVESNIIPKEWYVFLLKRRVCEEPK